MANKALEVLAVAAGAQLQIDLLTGRIVGRAPNTGTKQDQQQRADDRLHSHESYESAALNLQSAEDDSSTIRTRSRTA